jgi:hypothetical protein
MRNTSMDSHSTYALFVRGHPKYRNTKRSLGGGGGYKSNGRCKSLGKSLRECWKCCKHGNYKKYFRSKKVYKQQRTYDASSTEAKTSTEEGGYVYMKTIGTHANHVVWLIKSGASFHMTPHMEWFS